MIKTTTVTLGRYEFIATANLSPTYDDNKKICFSKSGTNYYISLAKYEYSSWFAVESPDVVISNITFNKDGHLYNPIRLRPSVILTYTWTIDKAQNNCSVLTITSYRFNSAVEEGSVYYFCCNDKCKAACSWDLNVEDDKTHDCDIVLSFKNLNLTVTNIGVYDDIEHSSKVSTQPFFARTEKYVSFVGDSYNPTVYSYRYINNANSRQGEITYAL